LLICSESLVDVAAEEASASVIMLPIEALERRLCETRNKAKRRAENWKDGDESFYGHIDSMASSMC
jgi:hypothetical protein